MGPSDRSGPTPMRGNRAGADMDDDERLLDESDDLRYEGPIQFDETGPERGSGGGDGGGKVFLTAALIGASVVLLIGIALWLHRPSDAAGETAGATSSASSSTSGGPRVSQPDPAKTPQPPGAAPATPLDTTVPSATGAENGPPPESAAPSVADQRPPADALREVPSEPEPAAPTEWPSGETEAASERPSATTATTAKAARPAVEAPAPAPSKTAEPAPARSTEVTAPKASAASKAVELPSKPARAPAGSVHRLVADGHVEQAAQKGLAKARRDASKWSLQVANVCQERSVKNAFAAVDSDRLFVVPAAKRCWRVLWGTYPSRASAKSGAHDVPAYFTKGTKPIAVPLREVAGK